MSTLSQIESQAMQILEDRREAPVGAYIQKAAGTGGTHKGNLAAYDNYRIVPRALGGVMDVDTSVQLSTGDKIKIPYIIAPTAWHKMFSPNGEADTSLAAFAAQTVMTASFYSTSNFAEMKSEKGHLWFNLLPYKDDLLMRQAIYTAAQNCCKAIVLTVDAPLGCKGSAQFAYPIAQLPLLPMDKTRAFRTIAEYYQTHVDSGADWKRIGEIIKKSELPVILKGILHPNDLPKAHEAGAKGIVISNHGGRQMDNVISTLDALAAIREDGRWDRYFGSSSQMDVYLDGGIRSGADAFKAIALGAKALLLGRPILYGLTVGGFDGVTSVLETLTEELKETMQMTGCETLSDINSSLVRKVR